MLNINDHKKLNEPKKVLLTEDDPMALFIHTKYLEKMGFEVDCACDGKQAYEKYLNNYNLYRLIMLDGSMPEMDGVELAKRIRLHEKEFGLKRKLLILISAHLRQQIAIWCQEADIDGFEVKPVSPEGLEFLIVHCLSKIES